MNIELIGTIFLKTDLQNIKDVENKLNISFPDEYVQFLLKQNGGYPKKGYFSFPDGSNKSVINAFYPIGTMDDNLLEVYEDLEDNLPEEYLSIADDPGGNQILLEIDKEDTGKIYFWEHDVDPEEENPLHFLANSLTDFLNMLE